MPNIEQHNRTYTHMYVPLISNGNFVDKIRTDFELIHRAPNSTTEKLLLTIHEMAECWLLFYAQKNILMIPGNLRAGLQVFEGTDINEITQHSTYTMQHQPTKILPELKKLLTFAYRRGMFAKKPFDTMDEFAIAEFLKDLLLEDVDSPAGHPFLVEFCLMFPFRVKNNSIYMISCDTLSSVFSKMVSACKAGVCSFICSVMTKAYVHGHHLLHEIRNGVVLHIISPIVRQLREMNGRIPKRHKTVLDSNGNITVDQFHFQYDDWSNIIPRTLELMKYAIRGMAVGDWWEMVVDVSLSIGVEVNHTNAELHLIGVSPMWKKGKDLPINLFDSLKAAMQMAFHGFGGGSARFTELGDPTMFHCVFVNQSIYYSFSSLKVFNHASRKFKEVERKLPPSVTRYFLLYRSFIQHNAGLFDDNNASSIFPTRHTATDCRAAHIISDLFHFEGVPDMTQIRHFWASVSNFVTGDDGPKTFITSSILRSGPATKPTSILIILPLEIRPSN
jgi:hypothetical protein